MKFKKALSLFITAVFLMITLLLNTTIAVQNVNADTATIISPVKDTSSTYLYSGVNNCRIRVDINNYQIGRTEHESPFWYNWTIQNGTSATATCRGLTFTLSNGGSTGTGIKGGWYNGLYYQSSTTNPLATMDGIIINGTDAVGDNSGGTIKLEISGLSEGKHTLTTWHSFFDRISDASTLSVLVDGTVKASGIQVPTRVDNDSKAAKAYVSFEAKDGQTVTVLIKPDGNGTSYNNAVLNAFEIDGPDPFKTISNALPLEGDEHWPQENGLSWTPGEGAVSHDVYIGMDYDSVYNADRNSSTYKGNQTSTTYPLNGYSHGYILVAC